MVANATGLAKVPNAFGGVEHAYIFIVFEHVLKRQHGQEVDDEPACVGERVGARVRVCACICVRV